jgi:hypothetical protein
MSGHLVMVVLLGLPQSATRLPGAESERGCRLLVAEALKLIVVVDPGQRDLAGSR